MYWRKLAGLAAAIPAAILPIAAQGQSSLDKDCWYSDEIPSIHVQSFQTMLMVGTFKCRDSFPEVIANYNQFMNSKRNFVLANQRVVQAHFIRQLGDEAGNIAYLEHQTRIGNMESMDASALRCESIATLSRLAAEASETDLLELAYYVSGDSGVPLCKHPNTEAIAGSPAVAPAVPPKVAVTVGATEEPGVEDNLAPGHHVAEGPVTTTEASADVPAPAKMVTVAAEKSVEPAAAEAAPVATAPTAAQALQEAAKALALAATALQAQTSSAEKPAETAANMTK